MRPGRKINVFTYQDGQSSNRLFTLTMGLAWFILLMFALDTVTTDAPRARLPPAVSACNTSVTYNKVLLKHVTLLSKYVFTGKVFGVKSGYNGTRIYKVNIRRVLKGDLNDIGVLVKFGTAKSLRFSDATIFVESSSISCPPLRVRTYGIFLTEKRREGGTLWLSLVIEPLVLTLRSIGIIEAVVKGKIYFMIVMADYCILNWNSILNVEYMM